nr:hypothetical protein [Tanacetum cinerariifolium]
MQSSLKRRSIYFIEFCSNCSTISTHLSESSLQGNPVNKDAVLKSFELMVDDDDDDDDNPFGVLFCQIVRILIFDL